VKNKIWPLPILAIGVYGLVQFSQDSIPENISRSVAQVEQEAESQSALASSVGEIISIESELELKRERLNSFIREKNEIETQLQTFSHTEEEILKFDERLIEIDELIAVLESDIEARQVDRDNLMSLVEDHDNQLAAIRCENQLQTSRLESELEALIADKADVTERILRISSTKDKLSQEIDDLRDLYVGDETKTAQTGLFNSGQDMSAFFMAMTSFFFSMNNNQGMMTGTQTSFMAYPYNQTMLMPGQPLPFAHHQMTYQPPMPFQTGPYSILDRDLFAPRMNTAPSMMQQQQPQQTMQPQVQAPVVPMGSRQISSDNGIFTFQ
jgi:hypothetical protein